MEATMESSMESSMELSYTSEAAFRASALASMELSYTSEAAFRANAFAHTSMFGHSTYDIDDMMEQADKMYRHTSMFGHASKPIEGSIVGGSELSDAEPEAAEGSRSTVVEGSEESDGGDGDVVGAEDNSEGQGRVEEAEVDAWDPTRPVGTTLSPEQRVSAHKAKFAAEFVVELNMTEAHETGEKMGWTLNRDADFTPATVWRINKVGLVEDWNRAHPDKAVHVGDEVVRVNDIQWHANTETFIEHIVGQFHASRSGAEGAKDTLRFYIQRPRVWEHKAFEGQRQDAHNTQYAAEFIAAISIPDELDDTMEKTMGWKLGRQHGPSGLEDWKPAIIKYIDRLGKVEAWNKEHPDKLVLEGDEILQLDNIRFHHNSTSFLKTLMRHYRSATHVRNTNRSAVLYIQRPRQNQEEFDATHPVREVVTWKRPRHSVPIAFPQTSGDPTNLLGWQMLPSKDGDRGTLAAVINKVRPGSLTDKINAEHPEAIAAGDLIVGVNGFGWEMFEKGSDFYAAVDGALKRAGRKGPNAEPVNLLVERPSMGVRNVRQNMERGVHMDAKMLKHFRELRTTTTTELPPLFGPTDTEPTDATQATGATDKDEVTGASEDGDNDVIGAGEDEPTSAGDNTP